MSHVDPMFLAFINESTFISNVNSGMVLDNSLNAKRTAAGMGFNTGQLHNDVPNPYGSSRGEYAASSKAASNYYKPSQGHS